MEEFLVFLDGFFKDDVVDFFDGEFPVAFDLDVLVKVFTLSIDWRDLLENLSLRGLGAFWHDLLHRVAVWQELVLLESHVFVLLALDFGRAFPGLF